MLIVNARTGDVYTNDPPRAKFEGDHGRIGSAGRGAVAVLRCGLRIDRSGDSWVVTRIHGHYDATGRQRSTVVATCSTEQAAERAAKVSLGLIV